MPILAPALLLATCLLPLAAQAPMTSHGAHQAASGPFDPGRDAARDLEAAKGQARASGRRILLDVGGNWCPWCRRLHAFWEAQQDIRALRDKGFVFLMVNFSPEQKNAAFLGQFPKIKGYPHLFVLDAAGKVLHSQDTGELEEGEGYGRDKMAAFLNAWKP